MYRESEDMKQGFDIQMTNRLRCTYDNSGYEYHGTDRILVSVVQEKDLLVTHVHNRTTIAHSV